MDFDPAQAEADLQWLLRCPSLLISEDAFSGGDSEPSDIEWGAVERFLETRAAHRVGYYVESLVEAWLESQSAITDLEHGIQVRREKETLGELDFVFLENGLRQHLEVALKFYLHYPERAENGSCFVGPNSRDSFERKRDRLLEKQLPFGREFFPGIEQSRHFVKGMVFYHPEDVGDRMYPDKLNCEHARGSWIRHRELDEYLEGWSPDRTGRILKKPYWLSAIGDDLLPGRIRVAAGEHFAKWQGPVFLAEMEGGREARRLFVMPDGWPNA